MTVTVLCEAIKNPTKESVRVSKFWPFRISNSYELGNRHVWYLVVVYKSTGYCQINRSVRWFIWSLRLRVCIFLKASYQWMKCCQFQQLHDSQPSTLFFLTAHMRKQTCRESDQDQKVKLLITKIRNSII